MYDNESESREQALYYSNHSGLQNDLLEIKRDLKKFKIIQDDFGESKDKNKVEGEEKQSRKTIIKDIQNGVSIQMKDLQRVTAKRVMQRFYKASKPVNAEC